MFETLPTVFSKGWLFLFLLILALCLVRIVQKIRVIEGGKGTGAPVTIIKPFKVESAVEGSPGGSAQGSEVQALRGALVSLGRELKGIPEGESLEDRRRILREMGLGYRRLSLAEDRNDNLLRAAKAFYTGSRIPDGEGPAAAQAAFLCDLGETYLELAPHYETEECLKRAVLAYSEARRTAGEAGLGDSSVPVLVGLGRAHVGLAELGEVGENLVQAVQYLGEALKIYRAGGDPAGAASVLCILGGAMEDLSAVEHRQANLTRAKNAYSMALKLISEDPGDGLREKAASGLERVEAALANGNGVVE